jgi:hypothetical protein
MTITMFRVVLGALYGIGFATASIYVVLYRAWRLKHWRTAYARDASGIVVVLWLIYGWLIYRLVASALTGTGAMVPTGVNLWVSLLVFAAVDGYFFQRLVLFLRAWREERRHPTRVCRRCGGQGVVPTGSPPDYWAIPFTEDTLEQVRDGDDDRTPPPESIEPVA